MKSRMSFPLHNVQFAYHSIIDNQYIKRKWIFKETYIVDGKKVVQGKYTKLILASFDKKAPFSKKSTFSQKRHFLCKLARKVANIHT